MRWIVVLLLLVSLASAHVPDYSSGELIEEPEISKAFYGILDEEPHIYRIESSEPFLLYANILGPYGDEEPNLKIRVFSEKDLLYESSSEWEYFYEEHARDEYWRGSEFEQEVLAGNYRIEVLGSGGYSLAVGKEEKFGFFAVLKTLTVLPWIKAKIFGKWLMISLYLVGLLLVGAGVWLVRRKKV